MKEQSKKDIIKQLNLVMERQRYWDGEVFKAMKNGKKSAKKYAISIRNQLTCERWGIEFVLEKTGWAIEYANDGTVEDLVNF